MGRRTVAFSFTTTSEGASESERVNYRGVTLPEKLIRTAPPPPFGNRCQWLDRSSISDDLSPSDGVIHRKKGGAFSKKRLSASCPTSNSIIRGAKGEGHGEGESFSIVKGEEESVIRKPRLTNNKKNHEFGRCKVK